MAYPDVSSAYACLRIAAVTDLPETLSGPMFTAAVAEARLRAESGGRSLVRL